MKEKDLNMNELDIYKLFLGGTAANNKWREAVTEMLIKRGVPSTQIFNPVVADWNEEAQKREDYVKEHADTVLFYVAEPMQEGNPISAYSIFEAQQALYDDPQRAVVAFDYAGMSGHPLKQMRKIAGDLRKRFPTASIIDGDTEALNECLVSRLNRRQTAAGRRQEASR
jgi:hypothetical protein